jgi:hypothetical protein
MFKINIEEPHRLLQSEALKRIKQEIAELKTQYADTISDLHEDWNGYTCKFGLSIKGFSGSGTLVVKPSAVELSGELPLKVIIFKSKIKSTIRRRLQNLLS